MMRLYDTRLAKERFEELRIKLPWPLADKVRVGLYFNRSCHCGLCPLREGDIARAEQLMGRTSQQSQCQNTSTDLAIPRELKMGRNDYEADDFFRAMARWLEVSGDQKAFEDFCGLTGDQINIELQRYRGISGIRLRCNTNEQHQRMQLLLGPHYKTIIAAYLAKVS